MLVRQYEVSVPMAGTELPFSLCRCDSPEGAAEVVRVLLSTGNDGPKKVTVEVHHVEKQP